jgi:hypothetical protein
MVDHDVLARPFDTLELGADVGVAAADHLAVGARVVLSTLGAIGICVEHAGGLHAFADPTAQAVAVAIDTLLRGVAGLPALFALAADVRMARLGWKREENKRCENDSLKHRLTPGLG